MNFRKALAPWTIATAVTVYLASAAFAQPMADAPPPPNAPPPKPAVLGPYKVTVATDPSLPTHTIYRPADLSSFKGGKLPIVLWGNGGCINSGRAYEAFLTTISSHGYIVVAIGPDNIPPPDLSKWKPGTPLPPLPPSMISKASQLIDGLDWALAQNGLKGSPYKGKLNPKKVAVMGQSCGGMQAIKESADPRIKTSVIWNSGVLTGPMPAMAGSKPLVMPAKKDDLKAFHAPVAYIIGGPSDIAYAASEDDFKLIRGVPVFNANLNVGHAGTYHQPNGGWFAEVGASWLDWQLKGDKQAAKMFLSVKCGLCIDPAWTVKKKNMD